jgi:hypothetical protein
MFIIEFVDGGKIGKMVDWKNDEARKVTTLDVDLHTVQSEKSYCSGDWG